MFYQVRCRFHSDHPTVSDDGEIDFSTNIYVSPLAKERPEDLSLIWVDVMAEHYHPIATEPVMHAAFIEQYKSPLTSKIVSDKAYHLAIEFCKMNLRHVQAQAEAIRDELIGSSSS